MTRHARNCTAGAVYTYHEKRRDKESSGYGTNTQRIGKNSVKSFDCCSLTLQPCRNPVVTSAGVLFDKEAILKYIIEKKNEYARKLKAFENQKKSDEAELFEVATAEQKKKLQAFLNLEKNVASTSSSSSGSSISNVTGDQKSKLPSFWAPSQTPDAKRSKVNKPDSKIYCPITQTPLKSKDLITVKFTLVPDDGKDKKSLIAKEERYMCPVTKDVLSNSIPCAVIRTTGDVVTMECVERFIRKDWIHPLTNETLTEKDIIPLQRGGTGFATTNEELEGKDCRPALQA